MCTVLECDLEQTKQFQLWQLFFSGDPTEDTGRVDGSVREALPEMVAPRNADPNIDQGIDPDLLRTAKPGIRFLSSKNY
jgi:hypothetical protein